jgi:hypothetical protein
VGDPLEHRVGLLEAAVEKISDALAGINVAVGKLVTLHEERRRDHDDLDSVAADHEQRLRVLERDGAATWWVKPFSYTAVVSIIGALALAGWKLIVKA